MTHEVRTRRSAEDFPRTEHLAWKIAEVAADPVEVPPETEEMVINRIIDNAAVAAASVIRRPVTVARTQALAHRTRAAARPCSASTARYSPEWAAWANGVAVRELDFHDTFLAAEYSHPGDNIPPLLAVAQHLGVRGADLIRGLATAYEVQIDLVRGSACTSTRSTTSPTSARRSPPGSGTMLRLDAETIYRRSGRHCT